MGGALSKRKVTPAEKQHPLEAMFGEELIANSRTGESFRTKSLVAGGTKTTLLYFGAGWCPYSRKFTPYLSQAYEGYKHSLGGEKTKFGETEVVFVSSDRSTEDFLSSHRQMPFPAMSFDPERTKALWSAFGVRGVPWLVLIDNATGERLSNSEFLKRHIASYGAQVFPLTAERIRATPWAKW